METADRPGQEETCFQKIVVLQNLVQLNNEQHLSDLSIDTIFNILLSIYLYLNLIAIYQPGKI